MWTVRESGDAEWGKEVYTRKNNLRRRQSEYEKTKIRNRDRVEM